MQIVILAAGNGKRMGELTQNVPKPLLLYKGITLLEHKLKALPSNTTEIIIVVGYLGEKIREFFGDIYNTIPIRYVEQKIMNGTAGALWLCKEILHDSFMILMSDDIYSKEDLEKLSLTESNNWSMLTYPDLPTTKAGKIVKNKYGNLVEIVNDFEGITQYYLLYTGVCVLTPEIFTKDMFKISNTEFGLPQSFAQFAQDKKIKIHETNNWIRITSPQDLK